MKTERLWQAVLLCCLLAGMPKLAEAQTMRAAAVGFSYTSARDAGITPATQAPACLPNRLAGAALGAAVGAFAGAAVALGYALITVLTGPGIPFQAFILVGAGAGAVSGAIAAGNCPGR